MLRIACSLWVLWKSTIAYMAMFGAIDWMSVILALTYYACLLDRIHIISLTCLQSSWRARLCYIHQLICSLLLQASVTRTSYHNLVWWYCCCCLVVVVSSSSCCCCCCCWCCRCCCCYCCCFCGWLSIILLKIPILWSIWANSQQHIHLPITNHLQYLIR